MRYVTLAKPGILMGNAITACVGCLFAGQFSIPALLGLSLIVASGCVFNNILDRKIDALMTRTQKRPLVLGTISVNHALFYGILLAITGSAILWFTTLTAFLIALLGLFVYVALYTPLKPRSEYATHIGSIAGAIPPVVGYTAIHPLDDNAILLFALLIFWQMPHFYAISIFRLEDYRAARIPILPLKRGIPATKQHMLLYVGLFTLTCYFYNWAAFALGIAWLILGLRRTPDKIWARQMFFFSLVVIMGLLISTFKF